jgi:hypothetical protein
MNRRQFMMGGASVAASLAGCIGSAGGNEFGEARNPWTNSSDRQLNNGYLWTGKVSLPANRYGRISFSPSFGFNFFFKADASAPLDFYLLERREFAHYRDQKKFSILTAAVAEGKTNPTISAQIAAGEYVFIFDNTVMGPTQPDGDVVAGYRLKRTA